MGWTAAAIIGSAVIGGIASSKAASAQKSAANKAGAISEAQYEQTREDLAPWKALGGQATRELGALYGLPYAQAPAPGTIDEQGNLVSGGPKNNLARFIDSKDRLGDAGREIQGPYLTNPTEGIQALAPLGRGGDTEIAHVTPGEMIVPQEIAANLPGGRNALVRAFQSDGADPGRYVVGGADDSINPRTGMREYLYGADTNEGGATGYDGGGNRDGGGDPVGPNTARTGVKYGGALGPVGAAVGGVWGAINDPSQPKTLSGPEGYNTRDGGAGIRRPITNYLTNPTQGIQGVQATGQPDDYYTQESAMGRFYDSPDYMINFDEGAKRLEASAAARGGLFSGNTGTALVRYGQDYGNRLYNQYANRLAAFAGLGQTAATNTGAFGAASAGQRGNAALAGGAAGAQGWEGIGNAINSGVSNYLLYDYLRQ